MSRNRILGSPYAQLVITAPVTTDPEIDAYLVDAVPLTITLDPNAFNGDQVLVQDITNAAATHPITILASPGQTILNGHGASIQLAVDGGSIQLTFNQEEGGWVPLGSSVGTTGATGAGTTGATGATGAENLALTNTVSGGAGTTGPGTPPGQPLVISGPIVVTSGQKVILMAQGTIQNISGGTTDFGYAFWQETPSAAQVGAQMNTPNIDNLALFPLVSVGEIVGLSPGTYTFSLRIVDAAWELANSATIVAMLVNV